MDKELEKKGRVRGWSRGTYLAGLREIRRRRALTQRQLAASSGTGQGTIPKIERLERSAYARTVLKLAAALEVQPAELMPTINATDRGVKARTRFSLRGLSNRHYAGLHKPAASSRVRPLVGP